MMARLAQILMEKTVTMEVNHLNKDLSYKDRSPGLGWGTGMERHTDPGDVPKTRIEGGSATQQAWLLDDRLRRKVLTNAPRRRFWAWVKEREGRGVETPHTAEVAAEYVRSLNEGTGAKGGKGWKGKALLRQVSQVKYGFRDTGLDGTMWQSAEVIAALNRGRLTLGEIREETEEQRNKEKYEAHFQLLRTLFDRSGAEGFNFETATAERVDQVLLYVLAYLLFDIGVRGGNLAATGKEKELTKQEGIQATNLAEATWVKNMGHLSLLKDWFFIFESGRADGDHDNVMGHRLPEYWRRWPARYPIHARLKVPTTKTSGTGGRKAPPLTMVGRRTKIEAESFALLVRYLFWNRVEDPEAPLFRRRSMGDRDTGGRMVRIQDLTHEIKTIAILERVEAVHVAANCFRKGYVTTCTALSAEEEARKRRATSWLAQRGGNWAEGSVIPQAVYAAPDIDFGPYARVQTWEEAVQVGRGFAGWRERQLLPWTGEE